MKKKKSKKRAKSSVASEDSADDTTSSDVNGIPDRNEQNTSEDFAIPRSELSGDCVGSCDSEKRLPEDDCQLLGEVAVQSRSDEVETTLDCDDEQVTLSICKVEETKTEFSDDQNTISEACKDEKLQKYWYQRYRLFSRFDNGIKIDRGTFKFILCCFERHSLFSV